jgi:hypothetical protein
MTDIRPDPARNTLDDAVALWLDDDIKRAALIFARARNEAQLAHAACAKLPPASLSTWREPDRSGLLHRRMVARARAHAARQFLGEALHDWRPTGMGN